MERYDRVGISWRAGEKESDAWKGVCAAGLSGLKGGCLWSGRPYYLKSGCGDPERNSMRKNRISAVSLKRTIIGSSFRRLQDKTQVFPLDQSDFVRTRLTHSLEVSSLAKSLGQNIGEAILERGADQKFTRKMKEDISHILELSLIHI